jgi:hypothetical protein
MSVEIIKQFNQIVESFIDQITPLIGCSYKNKFDLMIRFNSLLPLEHYITYALPLRDKILNRDETYFIDSERQKQVAENDENIMREMMQLQNIYFKLDKKSQEGIWDYFQAMLYLGEEYIKLKLGNNTLK